MEDLNKVFEHALTNVCNVYHDDWDQRILAILLDYHITCKMLTKFTPFRWLYGKEAMILIDFVVPSLCIALAMNMIND